jgi:hypothetical protein
MTHGLVDSAGLLKLDLLANVLFNQRGIGALDHIHQNAILVGCQLEQAVVNTR